MRAGRRRPRRTLAAALAAAFALVLTAVPAAAFDDVPPTNPFYDEITWVWANGIANGFDDGTFRPALEVSRQAMAGFLQRTYVGLGGEVQSSYPDSGFSDVSPDNPFHDEIAWLVGEGIADGFPDGTFRPDRPVSRQAMSAFLFRVWAHLGGVPLPLDPPDFPDVEFEPPFGHTIGWLAHEGIASGFDDGLFRPTLAVSRQAMAGFLQRFNEVAVEIEQLNFEVDTTADAVDASPGDGVCLAVGGGCTLRAAVGEANVLLHRQAVTLAVDPVLTRTGPEPTPDNAVNDIDITDDLDLWGESHTIGGAGVEVVSGSVGMYQTHVPVGIGNAAALELQEGSAGALVSTGVLEVDGATYRNGNIWIGGGVADFNASYIEGGAASDDPGLGGGGMHIEDAVVNLFATEVYDNTSGFAGGGIQAIDSTVSIVDSRITDNAIECDTDCTSGSGGGLHLVDTDLTMSGSIVSGNSANGYGGGIYMSGGTATITRSTIDGNTAGVAGEVGSGGGISVWGGGELELVLSTVSSNTLDDTTDTLGGGGVHVASGVVDLRASTVAANVAVAGSPVPQQILSWRAFAGQPAAVDLHGTIVSGSVGGAACLGGVDAPLTSLGFNVASDGSCGLTSGTDLPSTDAQLGPLADNGSLMVGMLTHLPGPTSPVLDHIPAGTAGLCDVSLATDQRQVPRPQGGHCDVGAVERVVP